MCKRVKNVEPCPLSMNKEANSLRHYIRRSISLKLGTGEYVSKGRRGERSENWRPCQASDFEFKIGASILIPFLPLAPRRH